MTFQMQSLSTYTKLVRAAETAISVTQRFLAPEGLTLSQFGILEALLHKGPLCQKELGKKILRSNGNITLVLDNLEKRSLVSRHRNAEDRRFVTVYLSTEGEKLIRRLFPEVASMITRSFDCLSDSEQESLGRLCKTLGFSMEAENNP